MQPLDRLVHHVDEVLCCIKRSSKTFEIIPHYVTTLNSVFPKFLLMVTRFRSFYHVFKRSHHILWSWREYINLEAICLDSDYVATLQSLRCCLPASDTVSPSELHFCEISLLPTPYLLTSRDSNANFLQAYASVMKAVTARNQCSQLQALQIP